MTLYEKIQKDFIAAFKAKDENAKAALSSIKAEVTKAEKASTGFVATDDELIKILNKAIKQREESIKMYETANRPELVQKESDEAAVLRNYMPAQMTEAEIELALREIIRDMSVVITNPQALMGKSIGEFNKKFQGRADVAVVKSIVTKIVQP
jgi:uncharacterized protein YqeY